MIAIKHPTSPPKRAKSPKVRLRPIKASQQSQVVKEDKVGQDDVREKRMVDASGRMLNGLVQSVPEPVSRLHAEVRRDVPHGLLEPQNPVRDPEDADSRAKKRALLNASARRLKDTRLHERLFPSSGAGCPHRSDAASCNGAFRPRRSSTVVRSSSATLQAWAMQPRGRCGGSPSKISGT